MNWYKYSQTDLLEEQSDPEEEFYMYDIERNPPEHIDEDVSDKVVFRTDSDGNYIVRIVSLDGNDIGETEIRKDWGLDRSTKKLFPQVSPDSEVYRFQGIYLAKPFRNRKIGKKMILDMFYQKPDAWLANSELGYGGTDFSAINALESLQPEIEVFWLSDKGGQWAARLSGKNDAPKEQKFYASGAFIEYDYIKYGSRSINAVDLRGAIIKLLDSSFVPTYISWGDFKPGRTWEVDQGHMINLHKKLHKIPEISRYSIERGRILEWIRDYLLGLIG